MLTEIVDMGFEYVELSHGIPVSFVPGIFKALAENLIRVSSCHNFCPLPPHVTHAAPNIYQPSSLDLRERDAWLRHTQRSIDTTYLVGASFLVTHMGSIRYWLSRPERKLKAMLRTIETPEELQANLAFTKARDRLLARNIKKSGKHLKHIVQSLENIREFAQEKGVTICAENREGLLELPLDGETGAFYESVADLNMVKLWHDTGHAKLKERMGLLDHTAYLDQHHQNIVGFHLHDTTRAGKDHQALGTGYVDFELVKRYFREDQVFVIELSPSLTPEEVIESKNYLIDLIQSTL